MNPNAVRIRRLAADEFAEGISSFFPFPRLLLARYRTLSSHGKHFPRTRLEPQVCIRRCLCLKRCLFPASLFVTNI